MFWCLDSSGHKEESPSPRVGKRPLLLVFQQHFHFSREFLRHTIISKFGVLRRARVLVAIFGSKAEICVFRVRILRWFFHTVVVEILKVKTHGSSSTGRKLPVCQTPSVVLRVVQFYNIHTYILHPTTTAVCEVIITKNKEENDDLFEWFADTSTLLLPAANKRRTSNSTATTPTTTLEWCAASSCSGSWLLVQTEEKSWL